MLRITIEEINESVQELETYMSTCYNLHSRWDKQDYVKVQNVVNLQGAVINALIANRVNIEPDKDELEEARDKFFREYLGDLYLGVCGAGI